MGGRKSEVKGKVEGVDPVEVAEDVDKSWYSNTHNTLNYLSITHHPSRITAFSATVEMHQQMAYNFSKYHLG
ncbi:MAG TPA: hypothetical protein DHM44_08265 [Flexistipes sinusarabici]|uniref:Uncharacterized protein n=1 Tax=Flexistipes sinusarabici TaxID=2352 RepID=A0A3D5QD50_FLESI|nr:hypothetical protein [Flexistipes sinusarabici]